MNKIFITIATMALLTLFTSAYNNQMADSRVGYRLPTSQWSVVTAPFRCSNCVDNG